MSEESKRTGEIEQLQVADLGDAVEETREWGLWPLWHDSLFVYGEYPD